MKLLKICLLSSVALELAKLMHEQNSADQAAHLNYNKYINKVHSMNISNRNEICEFVLPSLTDRPYLKSCLKCSCNQKLSLRQA